MRDGALAVLPDIFAKNIAKGTWEIQPALIPDAVVRHLQALGYVHMPEIIPDQAPLSRPATPKSVGWRGRRRGPFPTTAPSPHRSPRMGCDIHLILEACTDQGIWIAIQSTSALSRHDTGDFNLDAYWSHPLHRAKWRDYALFAILSGVRVYTPRTEVPIMGEGLPEDASDWAVEEYENDVDLHSMGSATFQEIAESISALTHKENQELVTSWLNELRLAAKGALEEQMVLVDEDHDYDEYELSNHALLALRTRTEQARAKARAEHIPHMPQATDQHRLRVIVAYDN